LDKTNIKLNRILKFEKSIETLDKYPFIKTGLGYDVVVASLHTPGLATTREILFVAGGVQTSFPEEKPIVDCVENIDELPIPHMPKFEHVVTNDIVVDMSIYTPISEPKPKNTYSDKRT
jgi:hypothetical protein